MEAPPAASTAMRRLMLFSLIVTSGASACTSYRVQPLSPALDGQEVRVSVRDTVGHQRYVSVDVKNFWYRDGMLGGRRCRKEDPRRPYCTWEEWSVQRELVVGLRVKQYDGKKTGRAALAGLFATGAAFYGVMGAEFDAPAAWYLAGDMTEGAAFQLRAMCDHDPDCVGQRPAFFQVVWIPLPGASCPILLPVGHGVRLPM
jgi:hypothetical protein